MDGNIHPVDQLYDVRREIEAPAPGKSIAAVRARARETA
jgi:hypothetical protein